MINKNNDLPIVVLTPIRNNEWILKTFLEIVSYFADLIIIFDQASEDNSKSICKGFEKVDYIYTSNKKWLGTKLRTVPIERARKLIPGRKLLLGLDVDEFLTFNSLECSTWQKIKNFENNTIINFEKPDLMGNYCDVIRHPNNYFPLGFIDDGSLAYSDDSHQFHTDRIPKPKNANIQNINDIKFLHYGLFDFTLQSSKEDFYSVLTYSRIVQRSYLDNLKINYHYRKNYDYKSLGKLETCPNVWFEGWENKGINVRNFKKNRFNSFDKETLTYFKRYGFKTFANLNIWDQDWENCLEYFKRSKSNTNDLPDKISRPIKLQTIFNKVVSFIFNYLWDTKNKLNITFISIINVLKYQK